MMFGRYLAALLLAFATSVVVIPPQPAAAWIRASQAAGCPFPATAGADGCNLGMSFGGLVQNSSLLSGYGGNRPQRNVAGVDYGDGANANSNVDPAVSTPAHCTYGAATGDAGGPALTCSSVANLILSNINWSHLGKCVELIINTSVTGTLTVTNATWDNTATQANGCMSSSTTAGHFINIKTGSQLTALIITHSTFKGEAPTMASPNFGVASQAVVANAAGAISLTDQFNAYVDLPDRVYNGTFNAVLSQNNYINGFNELACTSAPTNCPPTSGATGSGTHGEYLFTNFAPHGTGSISGTTLTMTSVNGAPTFKLVGPPAATQIGGLTGSVGAFCSGSNCITAGTVVAASGTVTLPCSGAGCIGTLTISPSQTFASGNVAVVTTATAEYDYNFCANARFSTTCFYVSTGGGYNQAGKWSTTLLQNNTIIETHSGIDNNSAPLTEEAYNNYPNGMTITGNYIDHSGGGNWAAALNPATCGTTATFSGNWDMVAGVALTGWAANSSVGC